MVARYNPCGHVVDIGHDAYTTTARLYPDSDRLFKIRWYEALPDAQPLPFPSAINNLVFERDREDWLPTAVGEVFGAPYTQSRPSVNPLATGDHYCGTEDDFGGRGQIDEDGPPVEYRPDGLPVCCGQLAEMRGGLGLGDVTIVDTPTLVLAQVVSSTGSPPVHTCVRLTRDADNNVVLFSPETTYTQVLNPESFEYPIGAHLQIYEIEDWPGWFWGELETLYETTPTVTLSRDPGTGIVTAVAVTQLSVTSDGDGLKLKNDSTPPASRYYGTAPSAATLGYQDLTAAVTTLVITPAVINELLTALIGVTGLFGLVIVPIGGGVFVAGVDLTPATTVDETLVNSSAISVTDAASLISTQVQTTYVNSFNLAGMLIDRTAGGPVTNTSHVDYDGTETVLVTGNAAARSITFAAIYQMSVEADTDGLRLDGDVLDPGPGFAYSTDASGGKGWYPFDGVWLENVGGVIAHIGPASAGHTTIAYPTQLVFDARGHVVSGTAGSTPVTAITTTDQTGGPLTGSVDLQGSGPIQLSVGGNVVTFGLTAGTIGPAPATATTLTATPGNAQVSLSWTAVTGATSYAVYQGSTLLGTQTGTTLTVTGLTNGTPYTFTVYGIANYVNGPGGSATATPAAPPISGVTTGSGTTGTMFVALPANATGDLIVIGLNNDAGGTNPAAPSGWTQYVVQTAGNYGLAVYEKVSTGSIASVTFANVGQTNWRSIALNAGARSLAQSSFKSAAASSISTNSITVSAAGVLIDFYSVNSPAQTITPATATIVTNGFFSADYRAVGTGATGPSSATASGFTVLQAMAVVAS